MALTEPAGKGQKVTKGSTKDNPGRKSNKPVVTIRKTKVALGLVGATERDSLTVLERTDW